MIGFDGERMPFVACPDCRLPVSLRSRGDMHRQAINWLWRHNGKYHYGRRTPSLLPRRDLGLVNW